MQAMKNVNEPDLVDESCRLVQRESGAEQYLWLKSRRNSIACINVATCTGTHVDGFYQSTRSFTRKYLPLSSPDCVKDSLKPTSALANATSANRTTPSIAVGYVGLSQHKGCYPNGTRKFLHNGRYVKQDVV